ncbi:paraplegin [Anaeramoeba flamelloides]|uniref:Paraplegin n=1 Tax=Anaeramoeba flamelloides TaxID=1746091 RepID=A0AAV8A5B1_9EUKA|nr:paraplegin [Anaeramoeba flamelloides]
MFSLTYSLPNHHSLPKITSLVPQSHIRFFNSTYKKSKKQEQKEDEKKEQEKKIIKENKKDHDQEKIKEKEKKHQYQDQDQSQDQDQEKEQETNQSNWWKFRPKFLKITMALVLAETSFYGLYKLYKAQKRDVPQISWQVFRSDVLPTNKVEKLTVQGKSVTVIMKPKSNVCPKTLPLPDENKPYTHFCFVIPNLEYFEKRLEIAENQLGISIDDRTPVLYSMHELESTSTFFERPEIIVMLVSIFIIVYLNNSSSKKPRSSNYFSALRSKPNVVQPNSEKLVTFADVAGLDEAKQEIKELVDFLNNPQKYSRIGAKIPHGALLVGPPGTGKTLLAKAVAGEANVPFFSISGSEFVEMWVGVGAARVRDLFKKAKENKPAIIFIDEIDAVGRKRSDGNHDSGSSERETTLNQLLVELDGFGDHEGILVLAGTNRPDILDKALLRPGRFDRQVQIPLPDLSSREEIFKIHLRKVKLEDSVNAIAKQLCRVTSGFSGADIANVCNESALIAIRNGKEVITIKHFLKAIDRIVCGLKKKSKVLSEDEKQLIATHESGHVVVANYLDDKNETLKVSIIPRSSNTLGYAWQIPKEISYKTQQDLKDMMCIALGGRAAEETCFGQISTLALDDLSKVTNLAYHYVTMYGMNKKIGNVCYHNFQRISWFVDESPYRNSFPLSTDLSSAIDIEVHSIIEEAYERAKTIVEEEQECVHLITKNLVEKEVLEKSELKLLIKKLKKYSNHDITKKQNNFQQDNQNSENNQQLFSKGCNVFVKNNAVSTSITTPTLPSSSSITGRPSKNIKKNFSSFFFSNSPSLYNFIQNFNNFNWKKMLN